jgi:hypothetical protein
MSFSFRHAAFTVVLLFVAFTAHAKTAGEIYEQAAKSTCVAENINDKGRLLERRLPNTQRQPA